jgi:hypothetical protein
MQPFWQEEFKILGWWLEIPSLQKQNKKKEKEWGILLGVVTIVHNPDWIDVCVLQHSIYIIAILVVTKDTIPRNFRKTWS